MKEIVQRSENLIFKIVIKHPSSKNKDSYHLDYESGKYRQVELVKLIRDTVLYFALTREELSKIDSNSLNKFQSRAWKRISDRPKDKKGDFGEVLLFLLLETFYPTRKLVTKIRLRTSYGDEVKGFDCAHISFDNEEICFWLGEAKFHQSFSTAISSAIGSINEHIMPSSLKDELSILESNNCEIEESLRGKIEDYLNSGISLDKMKFKIPILLTYDCSIIKSHRNVCEEFLRELNNELIKRYSSIDAKEIKVAQNIELHFIIFPLESVKLIKDELDRIEKAYK